MPDLTTAQLQRRLLDVRSPTPVFDGPQDAIIQTATATTCTFTIPVFDAHAAFGPAPYPRPALHQTTLTSGASLTPNPHAHDPGLPPRGTKCLVVFVGPGVDKPRVIALYGWPTT